MKNRLIPLLLLAVWTRQIAGGAVLYVDVNSTNPVPPYTNWATAAVTIQDAVDVAAVSDQVLVAAGIYQTGTRYAAGVSNRVAVTKALRIEGVSGPDSTIIEGVQAGNNSTSVRCVYLADGAVLSGFTLRNGAVRSSFLGGGACGQSKAAWVSNCVVLGNIQAGAFNVTLVESQLFGNAGGGAVSCTLTNCTLQDNSAGSGASSSTLNNCVLVNNSTANFGYGGGANGSFLTNCTLINNSATYGGGSSGGILVGCTLSGNSASQNGGGAESSTLINCLITNNTASYGGGTFQGRATNCLIKGNNATSGGGGAYGSTVQRCTVSDNTAIFGGGASSSFLIGCAVLTNAAYSNGEVSRTAR